MGISGGEKAEGEYLTGLIIDLFAGGGGASEGIRMALGRNPDAAVNHSPEAVCMHAANHPDTHHYCQSVWEVQPNHVSMGQPVDVLWASPDCTHFSRAKGGAPTRNGKIRDLAWIILKWVEQARPRLICMENVEEFQTWGPLDNKGRIIKSQSGSTFRAFIARLRRHGYSVQYRTLRACDYGAPTIRKRFFLIARCDKLPIVWPEPTHGPGLLPYGTAAECIDWSIPAPSIFERKKPLAENTLRRIAKGVERFVINNPNPFIVTYYGSKKAKDFRGQDLQEPLRTVTTENRFALVTPYLSSPSHSKTTGRSQYIWGPQEPLRTVTSASEFALITPTLQNHSLKVAALLKHYGGVVGHEITKPTGTVTSIDHHSLLTSNLVVLRNNQDGRRTDEPMPTITAGGGHIADVRALLVKYYGQGGPQDINDPLHTIPTKDRFGLVMVHGQPYQITDIGMRMLQPRELYRAQGFPDSYIIDPVFNGKPLTKTAQVRMCGNSVPPQLVSAIVGANIWNEEEIQEGVA